MSGGGKKSGKGNGDDDVEDIAIACSREIKLIRRHTDALECLVVGLRVANAKKRKKSDKDSDCDGGGTSTNKRDCDGPDKKDYGGKDSGNGNGGGGTGGYGGVGGGSESHVAIITKIACCDTLN